MSFGLEVVDEDGVVILQEGGGYGRLVDFFNPILRGIPNSITYPSNLGKIQPVIKQGDGRCISLTVSGNTINYSYSDDRSWPDLAGTPMIYVVQTGEDL